MTHGGNGARGTLTPHPSPLSLTLTLTLTLSQPQPQPSALSPHTSPYIMQSDGRPSAKAHAKTQDKAHARTHAETDAKSRDCIVERLRLMFPDDSHFFMRHPGRQGTCTFTAWGVQAVRPACAFAMAVIAR